jgi:hypothetical protein
VEPERRLLAGEELPHGILSWLGEVVPVSGREAGLAEQLGQPLGVTRWLCSGDVAHGTSSVQRSTGTSGRVPKREATARHVERGGVEWQLG